MKAHYTLHIHLIKLINTEEGDTAFSHTGKVIPFLVTLNVER